MPRRLHQQGGVAVVVTPPTPPSIPAPPSSATQQLFWMPDYTSESIVPTTGLHSVANPGFVSGQAWAHNTFSYKRGIQQSQLARIVTGSDIPSDGANSTLQNSYKPTEGALSVTLNPVGTSADFMLTSMQAMTGTSTVMYIPKHELQQTSTDGYYGLQFFDHGDTFTDEGVADPTSSTGYGLSGSFTPNGPTTDIQQAGGVQYQVRSAGHVVLAPLYTGTIASGDLSHITGMVVSAVTSQYPVGRLPVVGDVVVGPTIQPQTTITAVSGTTATLSQPATGPSTGTSGDSYSGWASATTAVTFAGIPWTASETYSGTIAAGSLSQITGVAAVSPTTNALPPVGWAITGSGIPAGTTVQATSGTTITLSQPATAATAAGTVPTFTTSGPVYDGNGNQIILPLYNADGSVLYAIGQSVPCWVLTVGRGFEQAGGIGLAGSQFQVSTGDVCDVSSSWTNRMEVYDRYPLTPASSTVAGNYPDPVGSIRWYGISYYIPLGTDFTQAISTSDWIDITQWKGQYGGSPPRAVGIDPNSDGSANWKIEHDGTPYYDLGKVQLGVWTRFVFGYQWGMTSATGWDTVYKNGVLITDVNHGLLNQHAAGNMDVRSHYSITASQTSGQSGTNQITVSSISAMSISDLLIGTGIPASTYVTVTTKGSLVITVSNACTLSGTVTVTGDVADPIYYKNGIYRSSAWNDSMTFYFGAPKVGALIGDVWYGTPYSGSGGSAPTNPTPPVITDAPFNITLPTISGTVQVGSTLTATIGSWGNSPTGYTYQWQSSADGMTNWGNITGATSITYVPVTGDVGNFLQVVVTATNANDSTTAASGPTSTAVTSSGGGTTVPVNTNQPVIDGTVAVGSTLTAENGTWAPAATSYTYQWQSSPDGTTWANITSQTAQSYTVTTAVEGDYLRVKVTGANSAGGGTAAPSSATIQVPTPAAGTEAFVQQVGTGAITATSLGFHPNSGVTLTVGNHLVMAIRTANSATVTGVTDSKGNTWTVDKPAPGSSQVATIASAPITTALTSTDTITVTVSTSAAIAAVVCEYSGIASSSYVGATASTFSTTAVKTISDNITPDASTSQIFAAVAVSGAVASTVTSTDGTFALRYYSTGGVSLLDNLNNAGVAAVPATFSWTANASICSLALVAYRA